jgi:hypothetical protein
MAIGPSSSPVVFGSWLAVSTDTMRVETPEEAFERHPFDFGAFLASRFGIDERTVTRALGAWLAAHERPQRPASRRYSNDRT